MKPACRECMAPVGTLITAALVTVKAACVKAWIHERVLSLEWLLPVDRDT